MIGLLENLRPCCTGPSDVVATVFAASTVQGMENPA